MDAKWKALASPQRRKLLHIISIADSNAGNLAEESSLDPATVSHHLRVLREAGMIGVRREGRYRDFYLIEDALIELADWLRGIRDGARDGGWSKESYREQTLARFLNEKTLPEHPRQRRIVLAWFHAQLERDRLYSMKEVETLFGAHCTESVRLVVEMKREGLLVQREDYIMASG